jgi:choline dehydrogenase-like flavoprotein
LYGVRGGRDPLRTEAGLTPLPEAPPFTPVAQELSDLLTHKGLHPYRLPMACDYIPGCECCQSYLCARGCKNDSSRVCLHPAIGEHGAALLDECEVVRLEATRNSVTGVVCERRGRRLELRGDIIVLAAGALMTPAILLQSRSEDWPNGLANDSGLVGRNLMRHCLDLFVVKLRTSGGDNRQKELAFNDFYQFEGQRLGTVQSFGRLPPAAVVAESLEDDLRHGRFPWLANALWLAKPAIKSALRRIADRSVVLAGTVEDLPYPENRVVIDGKQLAVHYRMRAEGETRVAKFRALVRHAFRPHKVQIIRQAENNERLAHACGTCRFGDDPESSVLDRTNLAHGLGNLYVIDSSFFPSSAGTNPSLTIAANALRVADHILRLAHQGR